jgi:hypothetical protein
MRWRRLAVLVLLAQCAQGVGERCQRRSDCADGLACELPTTWACPDTFPGCSACFAGGTCRAATATEQTCRSSSDCAPGLACRASALCSDEGLLVCSAIADLGAPAETD